VGSVAAVVGEELVGSFLSHLLLEGVEMVCLVVGAGGGVLSSSSPEPWGVSGVRRR